MLSAGSIAGLAASSETKEVLAFGSGRLEAAAASFDCTPPVGFRSSTYGENPIIHKVEGPLESRVFALRQGNLTIGWGNADLNLYDETRQRLATSLKIPFDHTIFSCTHNHSGLNEAGLGPGDKTGYTKRYYDNLDAAVASLSGKFEPVDATWAAGKEETIVYNRKYRFPDGKTTFIREEDRVKLPGDYTGHIDPLASVVRFNRKDGSPMLFVTHYTGHPVISYNLEAAVANPDFCGWSIIDLVDSWGKAKPTGVFLQGCCGDISAKGMFSGPKLARESGRKLGKVFIDASRHTHKIENPQLGIATGVAYVPFGPLPSLEELEKERAELVAYQKRVDAGDPNTLRVIGYNFSETMLMGYRRSLAAPFMRWTDWAIDLRKKGISQPVESLPVAITAVRVGDIAIVAMPHELFVDIGLSVRKRSPFTYTIPAAYSNGIDAHYIGTSQDVGDREYMSAFYRYAMRPPFRKPAGDVIADKAVELLGKLKKGPKAV
ncbi:MAG: hypothetical protein JSU00_08785 [Acidobacteria bacterium]|nr:hypothetical protein [Acidobacteriota bacterium]